jgi:hypothetical protein
MSDIAQQETGAIERGHNARRVLLHLSTILVSIGIAIVAFAVLYAEGGREWAISHDIWGPLGVLAGLSLPVGLSLAGWALAAPTLARGKGSTKWMLPMALTIGAVIPGLPLAFFILLIVSLSATNLP